MAGDGNGGWKAYVEPVGTVLGFAASLAGWVVVVGGARVWARFHAAHISPSRAVALQPHAYLIAEGLGFLAIPLVFAAISGAVVYFWEDLKRPLKGGWLWLRGLGVSAAALVIVGIWLLERLIADADVGGWYVAGIVAVTAGLVLLGLSVFNSARDRRPKPQRMSALAESTKAGAPPPIRHPRRALAIFAAVALYSGSVGFFLVYGERHPRLDTAIVFGKTPPTAVFGFLVAETDGGIYVAEPLTGSDPQIVKVAKDNVAAFSFGPARRVRGETAKTLGDLRKQLAANLGH